MTARAFISNRVLTIYVVNIGPHSTVKGKDDLIIHTVKTDVLAFCCSD